MTKHEAAREIVRQDGYCNDIRCSDCPFYLQICGAQGDHLKIALAWLANNPEVTKQEDVPYWYPEHKEAPVSKYKNLDFYKAITEPPTKLGYSTIDALMELYNRVEKLESAQLSEHVEQWEPKEGEWVAEWPEYSTHFAVIPFSLKCSRFHYARLKYPDNRVIDCACDVETLKGRTDWI